MTPTPNQERPEWFAISQRLMRGYGPLAVFALMILLMSVLVPSKVQGQDADTISTGNGGMTTRDGGPGTSGDVDFEVEYDDIDGDGSGNGGGNGSGSGGGRGEGGGGEGGGEGGEGGNGQPGAAGVVGGCPDREEQVPGDPYSPPCIAFDGDNGGATAKGVTPDSIIVSYRVLNERGFQQTIAELAGATLVDTPETIRRTVAAFADYFSQRFQFYGRQLEIAFYEGQGSNTNELLGRGRDRAERDAIRAAHPDEIGAFADLSGTSEPYAGALANLGTIAFGTPYLSRGWHEERAPYAWSIAVDGTKVSEHGADYAVKRLYGKPAVHAGGDLEGRDRKFATLAPENPWYQESVQNAQRIVREAGHEPGMNVQYVLDLGTMSNQATNIIARLKREGITTILCGCDPVIPVFLSGVANRERYYPEFIVVGTALTDADIVGQLWNQNFAHHAFGVSPLNEFQPPTRSIAYAAYKSVRDDEPAFSVELIYYQMYMLAIGVHMAGPNLTPETFEQGMFAYPPRMGPFGRWSFGPGNRTGADDVREIYWDRTAISPYNGEQGAYIGASGGERWLPLEIPAGDPGRPEDL